MDVFFSSTLGTFFFSVSKHSFRCARLRGEETRISDEGSHSPDGQSVLHWLICFFSRQSCTHEVLLESFFSSFRSVYINKNSICRLLGLVGFLGSYTK